MLPAHPRIPTSSRQTLTTFKTDVMLLRLNLLKCRVMHIGHSCIAIEYVLCDNYGEHVKYTEVDHEKDLRVQISSDSKASMHCNKAVASALRVLSMIRRSFFNI